MNYLKSEDILKGDSIMNKDCEAIQDIINKIELGYDPDKVMPYDLRAFSADCRRELLMIYIKYGGDVKRKELAKIKLRSMM